MPKTQNYSNDNSRISVRFGLDLLEEGFTSIPNLVLDHYTALGITHNEMMFIIHVWRHWYNRNDPYPSLNTIAKKMGLKRRMMSNYTQSLRAKGCLITRDRYIPELGQVASEYDFEPLLRAILAQEEQRRDTPMQNIAGGGMQNIAGDPMQNIAYKEDEEKEYPEQEDIYSSKIRKAKSEEKNSDNAHHLGETPAGTPSSTQEGGEHSTNGQPYKNPAAVSLQTDGQTHNRNVEELEAMEKYRRSAAKFSGNSSPPSMEELKSRGGPAHIGQTLQGRLPVVPPAVDDTVAREAIEGYIRDIAAKLHDEAPLKSSTSRAFNLYRQTGADLNVFFNLLYDAEKEANRRSASIKKVTSMGYKNRMAYFFAILEDKLGLRQGAARSASVSP